MKRGLFLCFLVLPIASAFAYSQVVAFGDSLSDNGNIFALTGEPLPPYYDGRFSNGPVWVEYLAQDLGVGLTDMAYGGARTYGNPVSSDGTSTTGYDYGFTWQVEQYLKGPSVDPNALYTIWIGGNDLISTLPATENNRPLPTTMKAVANIGYAIDALYAAGARDIVLMNMPNLGATPLLNGENGLLDMPYYGEGLAQGYNVALSVTQALLAYYLPDLNIYSIDVFSLMDEFINGGYFDNTTNMLIANLGSNESYLFWDDIHPTTYAAFREILFGIINNVISTERLNHLNITGTAYTSHLSSKVFRYLDTIGSKSSGGAVD